MNPWLATDLYCIAGVADANGDPSKPFDNVFDKGETFQHAEIGCSSTPERQFLDNIHVTFWRQDARDSAGTPEDWGASTSASWLYQNKWCPFLRGGWCNVGTALYKGSVSVGAGYLTRAQDIIAGPELGTPGRP